MKAKNLNFWTKMESFGHSEKEKGCLLGCLERGKSL